MGRRFIVVTCLVLPVTSVALGGSPPGVPREQLNAVDNRRARAALLRLSDLPRTFRVDRGLWGVPGIPQCSDYPGDRSGTTITGDAHASFTDGHNTMGSTTVFFKTPPDLDRYWALTVRPRFATCAADALLRGLRAGFTGKTLFAGELRVGPTGADAVAVYRTISRLKRKGHRPYTWYETTLFLRKGRGLTRAKIAYRNQPCNCQYVLAMMLTRRLIDASHG
jgi:hypothetical protein